MADYLHGAYGHLDETIVKSTVIVATVPVYIGTASVNLVRGYKDADCINTPMKIQNLQDAYNRIGYSADWGTSTLSEVIAAHFDTASESVGPIYVINVLDPDTHRKLSPTMGKLTFQNGSANLDSDTIILDTLEIKRPAIEDAQKFAVRPVGKSKTDMGYNYQEKYDAAGATMSNNAIVYTPSGDIDKGIIHDGYAFYGLTFEKPEGAKKVTVKENGKTIFSELSLEKDNDGVVNGQFVRYFAFADAEGNPLWDNYWLYDFKWMGDEGNVIKETSCAIARNLGGLNYVEGTDYQMSYNFNAGRLIIDSLDEDHPLEGVIDVTYYDIDDSNIDSDTIIGYQTEDGRYYGIEALQLLYQEQFVVPNVLAAPGWSHDPAVFAKLCKAAEKINGHWDAYVFADLPLVDTEGEAVDTIDKVIKWKNEHVFENERANVCWPMVSDSLGRVFHISTMCVVESLRLDNDNNGLPFVSVSNHAIPVNRQYFGANSVNRGFDQAKGNNLNAEGITTSIGWAGDWLIWGPHTSVYKYGLETVDPRAYFTNTMRMLFHITNLFQLEWGPEIDSPMTRQMLDRVVNREQEKLDSYVTRGALIGNPTVQFIEANNPETSLLNGDFRFDIQCTPTIPMKSATVYVAYTDEGLSAYFEGSE